MAVGNFDMTPRSSLSELNNDCVLGIPEFCLFFPIGRPVNQVIEKYHEYNLPLCLAFIDYKKAFDSVEHQAVLNALNAQNISPAYIRMLDQIFRLGTSNIKLHTNTNKIRLEKGVRQGDSISPKLFTACLENVFRGLNWTSKGIPINGDRLTNLRFADDVVLFSESPQELQLMVEELRTASSKVGLEINLSKTKVMFNRNIEIQPIMTGNVALDQVDRYIYLGQLISIHRDWEPEVRRRVALGWQAFGRLNNVWSSKLPLCLKRKKDLKGMDMTTILELDIKILQLARVIAKISNKWPLEGRKKLLNLVKESKDKKLIRFYGKRVKMNELKSIEEFESYEDFIPEMSTDQLLKIKDPETRNFILSALSDDTDARVKKLPLILKYFGPPSTWTVNTFTRILKFLSSIPEAFVKQLNSSMAFEAKNQLDSLFKDLLLAAKPQANAYMKVLLKHLNFSDPSDRNVFLSFKHLKKALLDVDDLSDEAKKVIVADLENIPNLRPSIQDNLQLVISVTERNDNLSLQDIQKLGKAIGSMRPRKLRKLNLDKSILNAALNGMPYGQQNMLFFKKQAERMYPNKKSQFSVIPKKLLPKVMNRLDVSMLSASNAVELFQLFQDVDVKDSVDLGQMITTISRIGGPIQLLGSRIVHVGNFAMGVSTQQVSLWSTLQLENLINVKKAENPSLESLYAYKKYENSNFTAGDIGTGITLLSLTPNMWKSIPSSDYIIILQDENVLKMIKEESVPEIVKELSKMFLEMSKMMILTENMTETETNMIDIHADLSAYPSAVVAQSFSLDKLLKLDRCAELLMNLPNHAVGMANFGGRGKRRAFGQFLVDCMAENKDYMWDVLESAAIVDLPVSLINDEISPKDMLSAWMSLEPETVTCLPAKFGKAVAQKLEKSLRYIELMKISIIDGRASIYLYCNTTIETFIPDLKILENEYATLTLIPSERESENEMMEKLFEISKSVAQKTFQAVKNKVDTRQKRDARKAVTCEEIQIMGTGILSLSFAEIDSISPVEILDCFDIFGQYLKLDATNRNLVLDKLLAGLGGFQNLSSDDIAVMGYLLLSLTPKQIDQVKLDSWELVRHLGKISKYLTESQMTAIASNIKKNLKNSLYSYSSAEISDLENLFCGFPLNEINLMTKQTFMTHESVLGQLQNCSKNVMMVLGSLAVQVYGDPSIWQASTVKRIGAVAGGLESSLFMKLKADSFYGFTPSAVIAMHPGNLKVLQENQFSMIPTDSILQFSEEQVRNFNPKVLKSYNHAINTVDDDNNDDEKNSKEICEGITINMIFALITVWITTS
ncbi:putative uncharacterized transposon-derived protein F52C9.6 [Nymphon striatum]|nr:putative uncharacterized transposon-derived protein F52C9.6 [Nymphon striatum]